MCNNKVRDHAELSGTEERFEKRIGGIIEIGIRPHHDDIVTG
ncbi:Uncharacterised protein [Mycobacteroides abscessus subsp. abscessus]|nr:Uncharacterised protein [Mycobacteroides abscessus subsp. abscessus]SKW15065.1 Uncharacterised protein [Mycobacteroides abscessus subsp. abscessus]